MQFDQLKRRDAVWGWSRRTACSPNTEPGAFTLAICTPSLMTSTVPLLRKSSPPVFEPAVSTTSRAPCFTTGKPASLLSRVAKSGTSEGMGRSLFRSVHDAAMNPLRSIVIGAALLMLPAEAQDRLLPAEAQDRRFETDPIVTVRENFVACDVLSQLQRVMDDPRFLLTGECEPLSAGRRIRIYASRGPYMCIYPQDTITPCKWTHQKVLSK